MSTSFSDTGSLARTPPIGNVKCRRESGISQGSKTSPRSRPMVVDVQALRSALLNVIYACQCRGIIKSAEWAARQLISLSRDEAYRGRLQELDRIDTGYCEMDNSKEEELCLLARIYFDTCEYKRAAQLLNDAVKPKGIYLKHYALYMESEKHYREQVIRNEDPLRIPNYNGKRLFDISRSLEKHGCLDGYCLYLHGLMNARMGNKESALDSLIKSVNIEPYNWSAWEEICVLVEDAQHLEKITPNLPLNILFSFFILNLASSYDIHNENVLEELDYLKHIFPGSTYLNLQEAMLYYKQTQYEKSLSIFEDYRNSEPYSLECVDYQSNMLFVLEDVENLGKLATNAFSIDRYRSESCVAVGNYFCLRRDHFKAIKYFERALKLKPRYTDVYIMIGHEYLEEKNINAAMEAYRCATETSSKDFRGWYGMGHTLASIDQLSEASVYFQSAASRQPADARPWTQLGYVYQRMNVPELSAQCWKRALSCANAEPMILYNLGALYGFEKTDFQNDDIATACFKNFLCNISAADKNMQPVISSKTYLAAYYLEKKNFEACIKYIRDIKNTEHGNVLLKELGNILTSGNLVKDKKKQKRYLDLLYKSPGLVEGSDYAELESSSLQSCEEVSMQIDSSENYTMRIEETSRDGSLGLDNTDKYSSQGGTLSSPGYYPKRNKNPQ